MSLLRKIIPLFAWATLHTASAQQAVAVRVGHGSDGNLSSGGYEPPALSLIRLLETEPGLSAAMMTFAQTGDSATFREGVLRAANLGDIGAELLLGEQYVPEQCPFEPDQDVPHCGKARNEPPRSVSRGNPLDIAASYEDAAVWLQKASEQGSGEASEILAQLITRMQANGHRSAYTGADAERLHALARSQGVDIELISTTCFKLIRSPGGLRVDYGAEAISTHTSSDHFSDQELAEITSAGVSGSLLYSGGSAQEESVLLTRPSGPAAHIRIILDHNPGHHVLLPIPAHRDVIYVQHGEEFLGFPSAGANLPRFISIVPVGANTSAGEVMAYTQQLSGAQAGGGCADFR